MKQLNDQYFTYRQTPVDYDGVARPSIKGNTLVWNQLLVPQSSGYFTSNRCTTVYTNGNSVSTATNQTTYYSFGIFRKTGSGGLRPIANHKYFFSAEVTINFEGSVKLGFDSGDEYVPIDTNKKTRLYFVKSTTSSSNTFVCFVSTVGGVYPTSSDTLSIDNWWICDLTQAYGEGNEPTADEFVSLFSLPMYAYDSGSLLNFNGTGIKTTNADETEESTTTLPISTYFPTGMKDAGNGANIVYDELSDKAITRIHQVDLGDLEFLYNSAQARFYAGIPEMKKGAKLKCAMYETVAWNSGSGSNMGMYCSSSSPTVSFWNSSYSDPDVFKSAMSGVYLNYELATYTEQDVDPIYYDFYGNGTEQLIPVNTDTPTTSPLLADIIYYNLTDSEVPYRVFWAINSKGERWDFTEREFKSFMNNPQGLGFSKTISVNRYGNVQNLTDITDNFPQPNGEVLFYDSHNSTRYDKYNQFVKFLSYEPITLYYKIPVSFFSRIPNTYSLECVVGTLTKAESKTDHMLTCSINYNALSFYKGEEVEISGTGTSYTINNDSDFPIGFEIQIDGTSMVNPYIQLSQNGNLYGEAKFVGNMNRGTPNTPFSKIYVNSNDGEQNVILEEGGSVLPNPLSYQDLSISNGSIYVTFVKLARGESTLTLGKDSGTFSGVTIRYTPIYRSV